jgi:hypothetical protein
MSGNVTKADAGRGPKSATLDANSETEGEVLKQIFESTDQALDVAILAAKGASDGIDDVQQVNRNTNANVTGGSDAMDTVDPVSGQSMRQVIASAIRMAHGKENIYEEPEPIDPQPPESNPFDTYETALQLVDSSTETVGTVNENTVDNIREGEGEVVEEQQHAQVEAQAQNNRLMVDSVQTYSNQTAGMNESQLAAHQEGLPVQWPG